MNIANLDKAEVLVKLYDAAKVQGVGEFFYQPCNFTVETARQLLAKTQKFEYLNGKVLKIDLSSNKVDTSYYNRDNGKDAAENAIAPLRAADSCTFTY